METVSLLVKSAISAAVAQVLPLTQRFSSQNALGGASTSASAQMEDNEEDRSSSKHPATGEEGEVHDEELDEYERALISLLGDNKITGPVISEKIGRLLERCLGSPLDDKIVKQK